MKRTDDNGDEDEEAYYAMPFIVIPEVLELLLCGIVRLAFLRRIILHIAVVSFHLFLSDYFYNVIDIKYCVDIIIIACAGLYCKGDIKVYK